VCLEVVRGLELLAQHSVVVDLAVNSQRNGSFIVGERLGATVCDVVRNYTEMVR